MEATMTLKAASVPLGFSSMPFLAAFNNTDPLIVTTEVLLKSGSCYDAALGLAVPGS